MLVAFLLWAGTSLGVMASQEPQAPAPQPQAQPAPRDQQPAADKKVNRFALTDDDEKEDAAKETVTSPRRFYSGTKACTKCHEKQTHAYDKGPHAREWNERTPAADIGCERCHGPGKAHDDAPAVPGLIRNFKGAKAQQASDVCLECHNREDHAGWQGSKHDSRNVTCVNCHSVHSSKSEQGHLKGETVTATCATCHPQVAARLQRASHMPLREGKMECSSCHNPHGSGNVRLLRAGSTVNESCLSCHTEKRGPFLWEHKPVTEACTTCHDAHGSSNDRMLAARSPMLCQRCHIATRHPATPYDGMALGARSNRLIARGCMNCHQLIHGSNHPSGAFFQR
jgi:DmsE family decaheme c-type cytochrome